MQWVYDASPVGDLHQAREASLKLGLLREDGSTDIDVLVQILRETAPPLSEEAPTVLVDWLCEDDYAYARRIGDARLAAARRRNRTQPFGDPGDAKRTEIDRWSCLAELAVAQYLDLPWRSELVEDLSEKPPDVGDDVEVRWTQHKQGHLILHDPDHDDRSFVLVCGKKGMRLMGWTLGEDGKNSSYQGHARARNIGDYWVPAADLHPMYQLRSRITL